MADLRVKNREGLAAAALDWSRPPTEAALIQRAREFIRFGLTTAYGLTHGDLADCRRWGLPTRARVAGIEPPTGASGTWWRERVGSRVKRVLERGGLVQLRDVAELILASDGRAAWLARHPDSADPLVEKFPGDRYTFGVWPGLEHLRNVLVRTYSDGQRDPAAVIVPWEIDTFADRLAQHIVRNAPGFQRSKKKRGGEIATVIRKYLTDTNLALSHNWACSIVDPKGQHVGRLANRGNADRAVDLYFQIIGPVVRALGVSGGAESDFSLESIFRACAAAALHPDGFPQIEGQLDAQGDDYGPTPTRADLAGFVDRYNSGLAEAQRL
jgi:hypothetical protein